MKRYYIAYGSNLNILQMRTRCPGARTVGTAEIKDYELLFKGSKTGAYLTIEKKEGGRVPAAVWLVTEDDELGLDRYEGFPNFYYKAELELPVRYLDSNVVRKRKGFVYIMHEDRKIGIPSQYYMNTCLAGYRYFGFDKRLLIDAYNSSRPMDT